MEALDLAEVVKKHGLWLKSAEGGTRADLTDADLTDAVLTRADLTRADLRGADLTRADLTRAVLTDAVLTGADLTRAVLTRADLTDAVLTRADLTDADLTRAILTRAILTRAILTRADLTGAVLTGADLTRADLTDAKELPLIEAVPEFREKLLAAATAEGCKLDMQDWHKCDTVHCLAGWVVTIHPQGRLLESIYRTPTAAALILNACGCDIPHFFDTSEGCDARAVNWMKGLGQIDTPSVQ